MDVTLSVEVSNNDNTLLVMVVVEQPSVHRSAIHRTQGAFYIPRRLAYDQTASRQQASHDTLHAKRDSPCPIALDVAAEVVDPDAGSIAANVSSELDASQPAAVVRRRDLRLVHGDDGRERTNTQTCNDTPQQHHGHAIRKGLERTTNDKDDGSIEDGPPAAQDIANLANK